MAQYTINTTHSSVFGMDVHARTVTVCGIDRTVGEVRKRRFANSPTPSEIAAWMQENFSAPHYAAYESGCTGFHLARELRAQGIDCDVVAVSSIARSADDRQSKNDSRDASRLLSELISPMPTYTVVWVPDKPCEASRDLARARADAVVALKRAKQQLSAMLLRYGHSWSEKTKTGRLKKTWGREHWAWIDGIRLEEAMAQETLEFYKQVVKECAERVSQVSALVRGHAGQARIKPYVDALCCLKGIDTQTAFLAAAQFGDFSRFSNGRSVSKWLGVVPREGSSGERQAHGRFTKAGDGHLRSSLLEGTGSLSRRSADMKRPKAGQVVSAEVIGICNKANRRLKGRYEHLTKESRLHVNKARVAVTSELVRWCWVVGLAVQKGQAVAP
ncbi:MAG: IS110 family transposase [Coriobacteriaceae bacterium]|jgi:transposase|nr:IS110 family transposase [Coriobacteriaceae bacterium]